MRILVISNFYPPYHIGGYELGCSVIAELLQKRGHTIRVLTSNYGINRPSPGGNVYRELKILLNQSNSALQIIRLLKREWNNQHALSRHVRGFRPELIYFWNPSFGIATLLNASIDTNKPVVCFVSDPWITSGCGIDPILTALASKSNTLKSNLGRLAYRIGLAMGGLAQACRIPRPSNIQFASQYLLDLCTPYFPFNATPEVIHWGVDVERFSQCSNPIHPPRALYVGRLDPRKGVHTALEGFLKVAERPEHHAFQLTIVGGSLLNPEYEKELKACAAKSHAGTRVTFTGPLPPEKVADLYREHSIFLFPSEWEEPFSIALLEAMSSGLAVVGTLTGGTGEILVDGKTGLTFSAGSVPGCADALARLLQDPSLAASLATNAASIVRERYSVRQMIDKIEADLQRALVADIAKSSNSAFHCS